MSIRDINKSRGRPKTTGLGVPALVRLHPPLLDNLDAWIAAHPEPRPSRPEAIRRLLDEALGRLDAVESPALSVPKSATHR
jgi:hypothetical protein